MDKAVANRSDPELRRTLDPSVFTTTLPIDITVSKMAHLATMKHYFDYRFQITCGLSHVSALGSIKDWNKLEYKIFHLERLLPEMDGWFKSIRQFVRLVEQTAYPVAGGSDETPGSAYQTRHTWGLMIHNHTTWVSKGYGREIATVFTGWIVNLDPFDRDGKWVFGRTEMRREHISGGTCDFPVKVDTDFDVFDVSVRAGFLGFTIDFASRTYRAVIGYDVDVDAPKPIDPWAWPLPGDTPLLENPPEGLSTEYWNDLLPPLREEPPETLEENEEL